MKTKTVVCPVCDGKGFVSWFNTTDDTCSTGSKTCSHCGGSGVREVAMTNADWIRNMSDEELAEMIRNGISSDACDFCEHNNLHCDGGPCRGKAEAEIIMEWLGKPAEDDYPWLN